MIKLLRAVTVLTALSCNSSPVRPDLESIETFGQVSIKHESGTAVVSLQVTSRNDSADRLVMEVLAHCPVLLVLLEPEAAGGATVFDESAKPCTRSAQVVELAPGEEHTWHYEAEVESIRAAGVAPGVYQARALITTAPEPLGVALGEIRLP